MPAPLSLILPLASTDASLQRVGGKGCSLAVLAAAGLPVPVGFLLTTDAYAGFVAAHGLDEQIAAWTGAPVDEAASKERSSARIRAAFTSAPVPGDIAHAVVRAYAALSGPDGDSPPVAVRSSATAEDLPDLSFAGQQDTFLGVRGAAAVLDAIRDCWASLWTARAMGYRSRMGVAPESIAMGVVVQRLLEAEVSGVLFTANPATGERSELVVNASYGLGEAIVGGQVEPDTYVVDRRSFAAKHTVVGAKEQQIVSCGGGGTRVEPVDVSERAAAALSAHRIRELASLALEAEALFDGTPQDVEWAISEGRCWLLQSRPITRLPPPPLHVTWDPPAPGVKLIRRQVVENMPDPLSPLFADLYLRDGLDEGMVEMLAEMGMPFDVDDFIDRPFFLTVNGFAYCRASYRLSWSLLGKVPRILFWYARAFPAIVKDLIPRWRGVALPQYLEAVDRWKCIEPSSASDEELLAGIRALAVADATYWYAVALVIGFAKITEGILAGFLASRAVPGNLGSGTLLRGYSSRTLEAQEALEAIARRVAADAPLRAVVVATKTEALLGVLPAHPGGGPLLRDLDAYLETYGHQVYTLDFAEPTQVEEPMPVLSSLKALVERGGGDTPGLLAELSAERDRCARETMSRLGPLRRWLFGKLLGWAQAFAPHREEALFYIGAAWPTLRRLALALGRRLVERGALDVPEDIFYLTRDELEGECGSSGPRSTPAALAERAAGQRRLRAARMSLHPPAMVPEKERFRIGFIDLSIWETQKRNASNARTLEGYAVSPGRVTAPASVVLSPADFAAMEPGTILVCPTTTPAWTPLFAQAAGLVTDIGGVLAHGSIVAREFGIPAVMGTGDGTKRITSGRSITVDGDAGTVGLDEPVATE